MRKMMFTLLAVALTAATASAQYGSIKGQVVYKGDPPKPAKLDVNKDQAHCLEKGDLFSEKWTIDPKSKGVRWVAVWIAVDKDGKADHKAIIKPHPDLVALPKGPLVIDQPCCKFEPHLSILREGQDVILKNSSPVPHNSLVQGSNGVGVNPIIPARSEVKLEGSKWKPYHTPSQISCSIHPWMSARLFVISHPYFAVTDKDGNFEIKNIPAGKVRVIMWHEEAGWAIKEAGVSGKEGKGVTVEADKAVDLGKVEIKD